MAAQIAPTPANIYNTDIAKALASGDFAEDIAFLLMEHGAVSDEDPVAVATAVKETLSPLDRRTWGAEAVSPDHVDWTDVPQMINYFYEAKLKDKELKARAAFNARSKEMIIRAGSIVSSKVFCDAPGYNKNMAYVRLHLDKIEILPNDTMKLLADLHAKSPAAAGAIVSGESTGVRLWRDRFGHAMASVGRITDKYDNGLTVTFK